MNLLNLLSAILHFLKRRQFELAELLDVLGDLDLLLLSKLHLSLSNIEVLESTGKKVDASARQIFLVGHSVLKTPLSVLYLSFLLLRLNDPCWRLTARAKHLQVIAVCPIGKQVQTAYFGLGGADPLVDDRLVIF